MKFVMANASIIELSKEQREAANKLKSGGVLVGGVGSGKSRTALYYYFTRECDGALSNSEFTMTSPKDLYIITTAKKRDSSEWNEECEMFELYSNRERSVGNVQVFVDSWNNIPKYAHIKNAFFIFDEQRVVGSGVWVKSFLKIAKNNSWILLSATPGDTWSDYIPVFIANGWYKNRTEFIRRHVVYNNFSKYPKIDHYVEVARLCRLRDAVVVKMRYKKKTVSHDERVVVPYDKELFNTIAIKRWNVYEQQPVKDVGELCYLMRRVVNSDPRRLDITSQLIQKHSKLIVFYNFNYERDMLLSLEDRLSIDVAEWNGHKHQEIPKSDSWVYIVQYNAGAEGWNCIETNAIVFYSQSYSYKATIQAAGRIDRRNTPFEDLYYYYLYSQSSIDLAISKALVDKKNFNELTFISF